MDNQQSFIYIQKTSAGDSEADFYISKVFEFIGGVITMGNSIILVLEQLIYLALGKKTDNGMMGPYIKILENVKSDKQYNDVVLKLKEYNKYLNLAKHSVIVMSPDLLKLDNTLISLKNITANDISKFTEEERDEVFKLGAELVNNIGKLSINGLKTAVLKVDKEQ